MEEQMPAQPPAPKLTMAPAVHIAGFETAKLSTGVKQVHRDLTTLGWFDMESSNLACFDDILKQEKSFG